MIKWIESFKSLILFILIVGFTVILYLRNREIEILNNKISELPKIEYRNVTDTIHDSMPTYINVISPNKTNIEYVDVIKYIEKNLTKDDSLDIGKKVVLWVSDYNTTKIYDKVFKDDSSAYVRFNGSIYRNNISDVELIFKNRYPIYKTTIAPNKTEIYAGFGAYTGGLSMNFGVVTKNKIFYQVQADPFNKFYGAQISFKLFQFK